MYWETMVILGDYVRDCQLWQLIQEKLHFPPEEHPGHSLVHRQRPPCTVAGNKKMVRQEASSLDILHPERKRWNFRKETLLIPYKASVWTLTLSQVCQHPGVCPEFWARIYLYLALTASVYVLLPLPQIRWGQIQQGLGWKECSRHPRTNPPFVTSVPRKGLLLSNDISTDKIVFTDQLRQSARATCNLFLEPGQLNNTSTICYISPCNDSL